MAYSDPDTMNEVVNILESFDEEELEELFKMQINSKEMFTSIPINHFYPLYQSYKKATMIDGIDEDDLTEIEKRFNNICLVVINLICDKYKITIDQSWLETSRKKIASVAMSMYQFFVMDIFYIILNSLNNFITNNVSDLYNAFADVIQNKDVTTTINIKTLDIKYAVIASSLFDVTDYAFTMMDADTFFDYISPEYVPGNIIKKMYSEQDIIMGDFVKAIGEYYKEDLALRSKIYYELLSRIKTVGYLEYNPIIIHDDEIRKLKEESNEEEVEAMSNTDIEDDIDVS